MSAPARASVSTIASPMPWLAAGHDRELPLEAEQALRVAGDRHSGRAPWCGGMRGTELVAECRGDLRGRVGGHRCHVLDLLERVLEQQRRDAHAVPDASGVVAHGCRDAAETRDVLLAVEGVAGAADRVDLGLQGVERGDRVRGAGGQAGPGGEPGELLVGPVGEHDLADAGRVHRDGETHPRGHHVRLVGVGADQVDDLVAVDRTEVHGALRRGDQVVDEGAGDRRDVDAGERPPASDRIFGPGR